MWKKLLSCKLNILNYKGLHKLVKFPDLSINNIKKFADKVIMFVVGIIL
jgi:hypothetical protein